MNKIIKYSTLLLFCSIMFILGFMLSEYNSSKNSDYEFIESIVNKSQEVGVVNSKIESELSESELSFLEKHLFGQWRFSERLFELNQDNNIFYDKTSNFSEIGEEEIRTAVVVYFGEHSIDTVVPASQTTFSNVRDLYLFSMFGGFCSVISPDYSIEETKTNIVNLGDIFYEQGCDVQLSDLDNLIKVTHRASEGSGFGAPGKTSYYSIANTIYIDPSDVDTIYVDFCGLWKMERDDKYYGTDGKSEH